jgi:phage gpG-like protein
MPSPGFTSYSIDNDKAFRSAIARAKQEISDLTIPLKQIGADFYKSEQAIFKLKGPGQYPDLSEKYKDQKKKKAGFVYPILRRTGRLEESVTDPSSSEAIFDIIQKDTLIIGSRVPYGIYHQSDAARSKIPLRKFLFIGPEAQRFAFGPLQGRAERWLNILNSFVLKKMGLLGETSGETVKP